MRSNLRYAALLSMLSLLTLSACDSGGGIDAEVIDGEYRVTTLQFVANSSLVGTVNVLSYIRTEGSGVPSITLDLLGRNRTYTLQYRLLADESSVRRSAQGRFNSDREDRITIEFGDEDARRLLLPEEVRMVVSNDGGTLTATFNHTVTCGELERLGDPRFDDFECTTGGEFSIVAVRQ